MTVYYVQEWPEMPGADDGDAIIFHSDWPRGDWERAHSWNEAWSWIAGWATDGDTVIVLPVGEGQRSDDYDGSDVLP